MIRNIILLFTITVALLATACYDDKGSYDYRDVNEIVISGLEKNYNVTFKKDRLRIHPVLNFSLDSIHPERYEYEWKVVPDLTNKNPGGVIGTTRDLDYFTELYPGGYALYLKIKDKETGLIWMNNANLLVGTEVGTGFLLIGENKEGYVAVDMIAMAGDTTVLRDLLKNNGLPPLKGPINIMHTGSYTSSFDPYVRLWIMTEEGSYYVNTSTFAGSLSNILRKMIYTSFDISDDQHPVHMIAKSRTGTMASNRMVVCSSGDVFFVSLYEGEYYPNPVNRASKSQDVLYRAFPYLFSSPGYINGYVLYDQDGHRFLRMGTFDSYSRELADKDTDPFPWIQPEGRQLIYGENTMNTDGGSSRGNSFALLKDQESNFYIYKFYAYSNALKRGYYAVNSSLATNISDARLFAFSSKRTLFLYTVGSVLYAYDYNAGYEKLYQKDFGDEITLLKFDIQSNSTYDDLYIATYRAATGGTLQKYLLGSDQNTFELKPDPECRWEELVKIKNMDWRDSDK